MPQLPTPLCLFRLKIYSNNRVGYLAEEVSISMKGLWFLKILSVAFDKGDLLYLRDEEEKQRHAELELRDKELNQFAALRAKMERQAKQSNTDARLQKKTKAPK